MLPFFNPIKKLVFARLKQMVRDAEAEFDAKRKAIKAEFKQKEVDAADELVNKIIRL